MSTETIVEKILSDARDEADAIITDAQTKATQRLVDASISAENCRRETERQTAEKTQSILEKRASDARLESAKIHLSEKRKAVDLVYKLALDSLVALPKEDAVKLAGILLEKYAEAGDELFFAENFKYVDKVSILPVIKARNIKISKQRVVLDGGMKLVGKVADKDLSYGALLASDKETNQADLARKLFK